MRFAIIGNLSICCKMLQILNFSHCTYYRACSGSIFSGNREVGFGKIREVNIIGKCREKLHRDTGNTFRDFGYPNLGHFLVILRVLLIEHNFEPFPRLQSNCKSHFCSLGSSFVTTLQKFER